MTETPESGEIDLDDITLGQSFLTVYEHLRPFAGPVTRDLKRRDADALLRSYLEPGCFAEAVRRLTVRHLLVLVGEEETGKRLGAIALLSRMSLAESTITVLSPAGGAADLLSGTDYEPGRAYLLHDWIAESTDRIELLNLARKLAELGSYLVITRNGAPSQAAEVEQPWSAPEPGELFDLCLRAYGVRAGHSPEELTRARDLALTLPTPAEVVRLAGRLVGDEEPSGEDVAAWFDTKPLLHEVREVAALAFLHGVGGPVFERQFARLERICQAQERRVPRVSHPLVVREEGRVAFRVPRHRGQVLAELAGRYGFWLWQPLREWVRSLAWEGAEVRTRAAEGVALLAAYSPKDAQLEFLDVWARGGNAERLAAGDALSYMCADDTLATEALRIALAWTADPLDPRGAAAAVALGGGLSVRYPADAARLLRWLESGGGPSAGVAGRALALLAEHAGQRHDAGARMLTALPAPLATDA
ncbi:hypothetical protein ACFPOI_38840 [Nonomuraea angiospora]|uniref:Intracellular protease/amidase n=1 Tax=Nonomuraea angiospora TaxID=46172 RepID=A0ABR9M628_9ACTN|nr:hypothetical protein [Nonomuraea angiospora]MBE1588055.1 putative intracellular protease/amidase [Nonomuraea angiospora]